MFLKKFILMILSVFLGFIYPAFAEELNPKDYLASPLARISTNMFGYNLIAKTVAKRIIKKELGKDIKGKYKVKIGSFSGIDLKKGIFKSFELDGKDLCICDEFNLTELNIKTTSEFNYIDYSKHPIEFITDVPMEYSIAISENDFNKSFKLDILNILSDALPFVSFQKIQFKFEQDKLILTSGIKLPFGKVIKFSFASKLKVIDGKIILSDCETSSKKKDFADSIVKIINNHNILDNISKDIFSDINTKISIKNVKIDDGILKVNGMITLCKG